MGKIDQPTLQTSINPPEGYNDLPQRACRALNWLMQAQPEVLAAELRDRQGKILCRRVDQSRQVGLLLDPLVIMRHPGQWQSQAAPDYHAGWIRHAAAHQMYAGLIDLAETELQLEVVAQAHLPAAHLAQGIRRWARRLHTFVPEGGASNR